MNNANRETLLSIKDLEITFGSGKSKFVAVQDVNFDIFKGEIFRLLASLVRVKLQLVVLS